MSDFGVDGERAMRDARRMFRKVLVGWASDTLALRRAGLDRPTVRAACQPATPLRRAA